MNWDFPYDFMPTTGVGLIRDFLPSPKVCKVIFQSALGFSPALGTICRQLRLSTRFSFPNEDTSSVVAIVFMWVLSLFFIQMPLWAIAAVQTGRGLLGMYFVESNAKRNQMNRERQ